MHKHEQDIAKLKEALAKLQSALNHVMEEDLTKIRNGMIETNYEVGKLKAGQTELRDGFQGQKDRLIELQAVLDSVQIDTAKANDAIEHLRTKVGEHGNGLLNAKQSIHDLQHQHNQHHDNHEKTKEKVTDAHGNIKEVHFVVKELQEKLERNSGQPTLQKDDSRALDNLRRELQRLDQAIKAWGW